MQHSALRIKGVSKISSSSSSGGIIAFLCDRAKKIICVCMNILSIPLSQFATATFRMCVQKFLMQNFSVMFQKPSNTEQIFKLKLTVKIEIMSKLN
jgi:S-adenosylmethionine:diacylglycerol 3-amino-3-carboxypropyl transferase